MGAPKYKSPQEVKQAMIEYVNDNYDKETNPFVEMNQGTLNWILPIIIVAVWNWRLGKWISLPDEEIPEGFRTFFINHLDVAGAIRTYNPGSPFPPGPKDYTLKGPYPHVYYFGQWENIEPITQARSGKWVELPESRLPTDVRAKIQKASGLSKWVWIPKTPGELIVDESCFRSEPKVETPNFDEITKNFIKKMQSEQR